MTIKTPSKGARGNDILQGHYGQDSYVFNIGDGQDTINDIGGSDKLVFGEGIHQGKHHDHSLKQ